MDISSLLQGAMGEKLVAGVSSQLGVENGPVKTAISAALPFLIGQLSKNAQKDPSGINAALENKHDGSVLENLSGFLSNGDFSDGMGILGHVFGGNQQTNVAQAVSKSSGLNAGQVTSLLSILAPIVMGYLGKEKQQQGLDSNGIAGLLGSLMGGMSQSNNREMSMVEKLLDQDGDGSIADDVMDIGGKLLGGFFGKK